MAAYTWVGTTSNWSTGSNWTPAAPAGGPTSADTATINNTAACTVTANSSCLTLIFTGYTGTFTINSGFTLTVFGTAITLGSGMTFTPGTTGVLHSIAATAINTTITFAGITIPNLRLSTNGATASRNITISGTTPTVNNLSAAGLSSVYFVILSSTLNVTTSINLATGYISGSIINLLGNVNVQNTVNSSIASALTIPSGSTLTMGSNITIRSISFTGTGALVHNNFTVTFVGAPIIDTSTVTWWNIAFARLSSAVISSNLNAGNDFSDSGSDWTSSVGVSINVAGSLSFFSVTYQYTNIVSSTPFNMIGTGTISIQTGYDVYRLNVFINTTNPLGYVIGTATRLIYSTAANIGGAITLVGNSVCSFFNTTTMTVISGGMVLDVNRTSTGGSEIIMPNLSGSFTFLTDTKCTNYTGTTSVLTGPGKILVSGNVSGTTISGTATIEFTGNAAATWGNGTYQNNIVISKSGGAVVTTGTAITWGLAGRTLTMNTTVNFITNSTTFTLSGATLTINNSIGSSFFNLTTPASTVNINGATTPITNNLTLSGLGATFTGSYGWTCKNLICSTAGSFNITLQQAVAYRTTAGVSITGGTALARPTMRSSLTGTDAIWTLDSGATQSLIYVNGIDIDSSGGQTIWSFGVLITDVNTSINWNPGLPLRTVAYTFVN